MEKKQRHYVRVCRPRFEIAIVEMEEADSENAKIGAVAVAASLPAKAWKMLPFDKERYFPHVEECTTDSDMDAAAFGDESKEELIERFRNVRDDRGKAYLLLMADIESGEGEVIAEPWCNCSDPGALELDIANDWHKEIYGVFFDGDPICQPWTEIEHFIDLRQPPKSKNE
jgi:hypothetical protein